MPVDKKYGRVWLERTPQSMQHDEPVFIIRGADEAAPAAIRSYADAANNVGASEELFDDVMAFADEVEEWQSNNRPHVKVPD